MSGRSSQLPGLQEFLNAALPSSKRPFELDFVRPGSFRLDGLEEDGDEGSKTAVCQGLAMNFWNLAGHNARALKSHPIDERRRTRAIGVLAMFKKALRTLPAFEGQYPLLVEPDNEPINPEIDLPEVRSTNPHSRGFYLGMNFSGRPLTGSHTIIDAPQPFCHVRIDGGNENDASRTDFQILSEIGHGNSIEAG